MFVVQPPPHGKSSTSKTCAGSQLMLLRRCLGGPRWDCTDTASTQVCWVLQKLGHTSTVPREWSGPLGRAGMPGQSWAILSTSLVLGPVH